MKFHQKLSKNKEFHLELTENLLGRNYLKKFLKPKRSHLSLLGVGQLICENDFLEGIRLSTTSQKAENINSKNNFGISTVTVKCNSLTGDLLFIKASDFLKATKKDIDVWNNFESQWRRKQGESENRVAQIKHVLENKFDLYQLNSPKAPSILDRIWASEEQSRQSKKIPQMKINSFDGFDSYNNSPSVKDNFKRIAYQKVEEINELLNVRKPQNTVEKSTIFADRDGGFNISRANNPFITHVGVLESKEFMSIKKTKQLFLNRSIDKSKAVFSELSESIDLDSDIPEEDSFDIDNPGEDNSDFNSNFNARNMPCLQSICQKLWKKPAKETYGKSSNLGSTLYSSIRGGFGNTSGKRSSGMRKSSIRNALSRPSIRARKSKLNGSIMVGVQQSFSKQISPALRRTIYLDENNKIVDHSRSRKASKRGSTNKQKGNIPGVVFESGNKGIWDSISNLNDDPRYSKKFSTINTPMSIKKRFKSPNVINQANVTFDMAGKRGKIKTSHHRFKSTSPQHRMKKDNIQMDNMYHTFYNMKKIKAKAYKKRGMRTKVSRLMETFQSIPIKIQHRETKKQTTEPTSPNCINIKLK